MCGDCPPPPPPPTPDSEVDSSVLAGLLWRWLRFILLPAGADPSNKWRPSRDCVTGALEEVIAYAEGMANQPNDGYGTAVQGTVVDSPNFPELVGQTNVQLNQAQLKTLTGNPGINVHVGGVGYSNAFGRYQINGVTAAQFNVTDWTPSGQDDAAAAILEYYNAVQPAMDGNLQQAFWNMFQWASMPDSPYSQPHISMAQATAVYQNALTYLPECSH